MKLRATFVIEVEAQDYLSAADYQRRLEGYLGTMKDEFGSVDFSFRERRTAQPRRPRPTARPHLRTGNLHDYEDD